MGRLIILFGLLISPLFGVVEAQIDSCLPTPKNGTFVYDNADLLTQGEEVDIQKVLRSFVDSTSNVIVVVTHPDFCGYDPSTFAIETGDRLGVGRSDLDNGVVIAIKPRNNSGKGQIFIAIGEGLEGAIPDILTGDFNKIFIRSLFCSHFLIILNTLFKILKYFFKCFFSCL